MSQQKKLEQVLDLLLAEDSDNAAELLHQIIVEKARTIYESIVDEEADDAEDKDKDELDEADEVGGEPSADFTDEISSDEEEIESDEESDGEADSDDEFDSEESDEESDEETDEFGGEEGAVEDRVEDLETQLADLRAEFDALMGEEMQEPNHADLGDEMDSMDSDFGDDSSTPDFSGEEQVVGEVVATMYEKKKAAALKKAPEAKKGELKKGLKKDKKVDEETKFLSTVADTGQRGTARLVGTGKGTTLGAEQTQSPYTHAPSKKDHGGSPAKIGGGTGGEYGKYNGDSATSKTPTDNVNVTPKNSSIKADTTAKYTGGKAAGEGFTKSPLTKKPA